MNLGSPAPVPKNTASYSFSSSSRVIAFPTGTSVNILTPSFSRLSTSFFTILFGSLNSGIP
jgi:hypothetical protein